MVGHRGPKPQGRFKEATAEVRETRRGTQTVVKRVRTDYRQDAAGAPSTPSKVTLPSTLPGRPGSPVADDRFNELRGPSETPRRGKVRVLRHRPSRKNQKPWCKVPERLPAGVPDRARRVPRNGPRIRSSSLIRLRDVRPYSILAVCHLHSQPDLLHCVPSQQSRVSTASPGPVLGVVLLSECVAPSGRGPYSLRTWRPALSDSDGGRG